ncbi:MAG TPA: Fur family transcriptional regulator [Desulfobacterales bacterium]|nr:Fur family transcriptional regulator [Desulfobacterales bacterium]
MINLPFFRRRPAGRSEEEIHHDERSQFAAVLAAVDAARIDDRLAVLDCFLSTDEHLTLERLEELVAAKRPDLRDRAFLRETMEMFRQFGFAQVRSFDSRATVWEHRHLGAHHDHLICTKCGTIEEFVSPEMEALQLRIAREAGFHPLQHKMEIYGLCSACMQRREPVLPLVMASPGERVRVVELAGDRPVRERLRGMGVHPGVCLEVISNAGPVVVCMAGGRMALGDGIARHVMVRHDCLHDALDAQDGE